MPVAARFCPCVVLPCLDAAPTVGEVVQRTRAVLDEVIVVDDGSTDASADAARAMGARVVRHPENRGKGAALLTGFAEALDQGFTHAITLDADAQHDPADIPKLLAAAEAEPRAVVVGARDFNTPHVPGASRFGRRFSNFWVWLETGTRLSDTQSGFRAYPLRAVEDLDLSPSRFEWEVEVLVRARWAGLPVREVDVRVHYPPPEVRTSHYRGLEDSLLISLLHVRLVPRSFLRPVWPPRRLEP
jgi:glycosyltransferase involved in cell wall biosynthesis